MSNWTHPVPVWVSRKTAAGDISHLSVPMWLFTAIGATVLLNVVLWLLIATVTAVQIIAEAVA